MAVITPLPNDYHQFLLNEGLDPTRDSATIARKIEQFAATIPTFTPQLLTNIREAMPKDASGTPLKIADIELMKPGENKEAFYKRIFTRLAGDPRLALLLTTIMTASELGYAQSGPIAERWKMQNSGQFINVLGPAYDTYVAKLRVWQNDPKSSRTGFQAFPNHLVYKLVYQYYEESKRSVVAAAPAHIPIAAAGMAAAYIPSPPIAAPIVVPVAAARILPDTYREFCKQNALDPSLQGARIASLLQSTAAGVLAPETLTEVRKDLPQDAAGKLKTIEEMFYAHTPLLSPAAVQLNALNFLASKPTLLPILIAVIRGAGISPPPLASFSSLTLSRFVGSMTATQIQEVAKSYNEIIARVNLWTNLPLIGFGAFPNNVTYEILLAQAKPSQVPVALYTLSYEKFADKLSPGTTDVGERVLLVQEAIGTLVAFPENSPYDFSHYEASRLALIKHLDNLHSLSKDGEFELALNDRDCCEEYMVLEDGLYGPSRFNVLTMALMMTDPALAPTFASIKTLPELVAFINAHPRRADIMASLKTLVKASVNAPAKLNFYLAADLQRQDSLETDVDAYTLPRAMILPTARWVPPALPVAPVAAPAAAAIPGVGGYYRGMGGARALGYGPAYDMVKPLSISRYGSIIRDALDLSSFAMIVGKSNTRQERLTFVLSLLDACVQYGVGYALAKQAYDKGEIEQFLAPYVIDPTEKAVLVVGLKSSTGIEPGDQNSWRHIHNIGKDVWMRMLAEMWQSSLMLVPFEQLTEQRGFNTCDPVKIGYGLVQQAHEKRELEVYLRPLVSNSSVREQLVKAISSGDLKPTDTALWNVIAGIGAAKWYETLNLSALLCGKFDAYAKKHGVISFDLTHNPIVWLLHGSSVAGDLVGKRAQPEMITLGRPTSYTMAYGDGFYLTPTPGIATQYSDQGIGDKQGILLCELSTSRPGMQVAYCTNNNALTAFQAVIKSVYGNAFDICHGIQYSTGSGLPDFKQMCLTPGSKTVSDIKRDHIVNGQVTAQIRQRDENIWGLALPDFTGGGAFVSYSGTASEYAYGGLELDDGSAEGSATAAARMPITMAAPKPKTATQQAPVALRIAGWVPRKREPGYYGGYNNGVTELYPKADGAAAAARGTK